MLVALFATRRRQRWMVVALLTVALAFVYLLLDADRFRLYASLSSAIERQKGLGYRLVGSLGRPDWPAVVVGREAGQGTVSFVTADGQPHQYQGFAGPMKALHFRAGLAGGKSFILVFHHPPAEPEPNPAFMRIR